MAAHARCASSTLVKVAQPVDARHQNAPREPRVVVRQRRARNGNSRRHFDAVGGRRRMEYERHGIT
jgi:hypothetical protein